VSCSVLVCGLDKSKARGVTEPDLRVRWGVSWRLLLPLLRERVTFFLCGAIPYRCFDGECCSTRPIEA